MSDNLSTLFERRERNIGKPLRPPQPTKTLASHAPAPEEPSPAPRPRRSKPAVPVSSDGVERYSVFLSHEQAQWLKGIRGRLLVEGNDISTSEVVRLALEHLRAEGQTDQQLYDAMNAERGRIRGRGRPTRRK